MCSTCIHKPTAKQTNKYSAMVDNGSRGGAGRPTAQQQAENWRSSKGKGKLQQTS